MSKNPDAALEAAIERIVRMTSDGATTTPQASSTPESDESKADAAEQALLRLSRMVEASVRKLLAAVGLRRLPNKATTSIQHRTLVRASGID